MSMLFRILAMIIGVGAMLGIVFTGYAKGKDTLMGTIIGAFNTFLLFIVVPIANSFLNYTDSIIAMLIAFGFDMFLEAAYRIYQVNKLKHEVKAINSKSLNDYE